LFKLFKNSGVEKSNAWRNGGNDVAKRSGAYWSASYRAEEDDIGG
jgi:hypothetical protein